jgi:CRISPR-associated exonuclease Cas4
MKIFEKTGVECEYYFRVIDIKQWVYCPRILYYYLCLPDIRPITYKMKAGIEAGEEQEGKEARRSLHAYGLKSGQREFDVPVYSNRYHLKGSVDMVIRTENSKTEEIIPVDYKLSNVPGEHFQFQLTAYGLMLEEMTGISSLRGFLYEIPSKKVVEIKFTSHLQKKLTDILNSMQQMLLSETMPAPIKNTNKCLSCEFRRFCNDVL